LNYVNLATAAVQDPIQIALASYALKAAIKGTSSSVVLLGGVAAH
jgi:hypothetical protein